MSGTIVFLGAGSSVPWGLPVTAQIFPKMLRRLLMEKPKGGPLFGSDADARKELSECLHALLPGLQEFAKSSESDRKWAANAAPDNRCTLYHRLTAGDLEFAHAYVNRNRAGACALPAGTRHI